MSKNQKRSISRAYNTRLCKVLEMTRHAALFPTEIVTLIFSYSKSMAIGQKINETNAFWRKELHKMMLVLFEMSRQNELLEADPEWSRPLNRISDFLVDEPWPLTKENEKEVGQLITFVKAKFMAGAPEGWLIMMEERFTERLWKTSVYEEEDEWQRKIACVKKYWRARE